MYKVKWYDTLAELSAQTWAQMFEITDPVKTYAFNLAVEKAAIEGVSHQLLAVSSGASIRAILPCFSYRVKMDTFAPVQIQAWLDKLRTYWPKLLTLKIFFCGSPVAICDHLWGIGKDAVKDPRLMATVMAAIKKKGRQEGCSLVILKEIPAREKIFFADLFQKAGFCLAESLPNTFLPVNKERFPFPSALRTRYKRRIKRSLRDFRNSGYRWVVTQNFAQYADEMVQLYRQVLARSASKFEQLNSEFFRQVDQLCGEQAFALLCFNTAQKLVCFELVLEKQDALIPLYVGLDYQYRDAGNLYFSCINRIIQEAENRNKKWVVFGQTSYLAKAYTGSVFERLYICAYAHGLFWKLILKNFTTVLFPVTRLPKVRCYRQELIATIQDILKHKGIFHEPLKTPNCLY